jgi:hypothetical protein
MRKCRLWWKQNAAAAGGGSGVKSSPRSTACSFHWGKQVPRKNTFKGPPPLFFSSPALGNWHSKALVYGTGRFITSHRKGAVGIRCRNTIGRPPVRLDVDVTGFPRPTAPAPAPARQEISLPHRDAARRSTKKRH